MGETIFIVIIIIIIIVLGIVFASGAERDEVSRQQARFKELDDVAKAQFISSLKELTCSEFEVAQTSCFDRHKVIAFQNLTTKDWNFVSEFYYTQFEDACIYIREINVNTPTTQQGILCKDIKPDPNSLWVLYNNSARFDPSEGTPVIIPVSLYDSTRRTNGFGILTIIPYE